MAGLLILQNLPAADRAIVSRAMRPPAPRRFVSHRPPKMEPWSDATHLRHDRDGI